MTTFWLGRYVWQGHTTAGWNVHFSSLYYNIGNTVYCVVSSLLMLTRHTRMHSYMQYHVNNVFLGWSIVQSVHSIYATGWIIWVTVFSSHIYRLSLRPTQPPNQRIIGSLSAGLSSHGVRSSTHLRRAPRLRMSEVTPSLPLYTITEWTGTT
jgi:hypothetical protein